MSAIDLIVLGMIKEKEQSAYDLQKNVEYRNISKWIKVSTPSIYKKVVQLEGKGYINHGMAAEKWNQRGRKERLWEFLENKDFKGYLQEAVINLASEMAKICKP